MTAATTGLGVRNQDGDKAEAKLYQSPGSVLTADPCPGEEQS